MLEVNSTSFSTSCTLHTYKHSFSGLSIKTNSQQGMTQIGSRVAPEITSVYDPCIFHTCMDTHLHSFLSIISSRYYLCMMM